MATRRNVNNRKRIPVGGNRNILTVEGKDKGYVYRWVNDVDGRLMEFNRAGYEHVIKKDVGTIGESDVKQASNLGMTVSKGVGQGTIAYLMRIREEFYKEDQDAKAAKHTQSEELIYENVGRLSGQYGKIDIKR